MLEFPVVHCICGLLLEVYLAAFLKVCRIGLDYLSKVSIDTPISSATIWHFSPLNISTHVMACFSRCPQKRGNFIMAVLGYSQIIATCRFKKNNKEMPPVRCPLEIPSFVGTVGGDSPLTHVAKQLETISRRIDYISTGFKTLQVAVVSMPHEKDEEKDD